MNIWVDANGWPIPPSVLLGCLIAEILYFRGWHVLVKAEQAKSAPMAPSAFTGFEVATYQWDSWLWRGIYFLIAILISLVGDSAPIDILSSRFFWVHMIQHLLILVVMAPLLVAAAPLQPLWLGLPGWARELVKVPVKLKTKRVLYWVEHWLRQPAILCGLLIIGTWMWHWPPLYDLALTNETIHDWCEHLTFLAVSVLFWTQVIPSPPLRPHLGYLGRIVCIGIAIVQNVVLAVLLGFAQTPLYAPYVHVAQGLGGFSALQDQQLGAGIMWTFGDLPFMIAFGILLQQWLASQSDDTSIAIKSQEK
jgi:putative membrane protein